jgi:ribulose bisphosphate carboxylase small subunit
MNTRQPPYRTVRPATEGQAFEETVFELNEARKSCAAGYIRINAFDASYGVESCNVFHYKPSS